MGERGGGGNQPQGCGARGDAGRAGAGGGRVSGVEGRGEMRTRAHQRVRLPGGGPGELLHEHGRRAGAEALGEAVVAELGAGAAGDLVRDEGSRGIHPTPELRDRALALEQGGVGEPTEQPRVELEEVGGVHTPILPGFEHLY